MSIFTRIYNRINWKNSPDVSTPLNESNLNRMDAALYNLESEIIELSSSIQGMFTSLSVNPNTGVISIGKFNGTIVTVNTNLGKIAVNFEFDRTTQVLSLILKDGTREQVDLSAFITDTEFSDTVTIQHDRDENGVVHFFVKDHSIDDSKIQQGYLAKLQEQADRGYQYISETESNAQAAASSELSAKNYSESAEQKADDSNNFATLSESYCKGGTGTRQGEDTDNAKYYASEARKSASQGQVQSDWNETDESDPAYIKNKPNTFDIPDATDQVAGKMKLYGSTGQNEDGTITQKVISESLSRIGDLTGLNTNQKSNVVSAINEVNSGLGTVKDSLTNPNLIDNGWFNVNSRGLSAYGGQVYSVDRWKILNGSKTATYLTINDDGSITLQNTTSGNVYIGQDTEFQGISFNSYKLSVLDNENVIHASSSTSGINLDDGKCYFYLENKRVSIRLLADCNVTIKAIKLEKGSISTLANDTAPDYQTELLKCQTSTADASDTFANKKPDFFAEKSKIDIGRKLIIAHRGASADAPENTLASFKSAIRYGFDGIETDIQITSDNEYICMHDDTVDRTTDGTGNVSDFTLEQIKEMNIDAGNALSYYPNEKVPTFDEYLSLAKSNNIIPVIEIKFTDATKLNGLIEKVVNMGLIDKSIFISFDYEMCKQIVNLNKVAKVMPLFSTITDAQILQCVVDGMYGIDVQYDASTYIDIIKKAHSNNLFVNLYTVNDDSVGSNLSYYGCDMQTSDDIYAYQSSSNIQCIFSGEFLGRKAINPYEEIAMKSGKPIFGNVSNITEPFYKQDLYFYTNAKNRCLFPIIYNIDKQSVKAVMSNNISSNIVYTSRRVLDTGLLDNDYGWLSTIEPDNIKTITKDNSTSSIAFLYVGISSGKFTLADLERLYNSVHYVKNS